jgi:hypothetical protein
MAVQQLGREQAANLTTEEMERLLDQRFRAETQAFSDNPSLDESYNPPPKKKDAPLRDRATEKGNNMKVPPASSPKVDLGPEYETPYHILDVRLDPVFNPDNNRNTGYGPKGNIFPSSPEQRADYDKMYGGTGSANAKAAQKLRDMGREGYIMRRARERVENRRNPVYGGYEDEPPAFDLKRLFGK